MICENFGVEAATRYVSFHQNIGALVIRFPSSVSGRLCKSCIHKTFWRMSGTTVVLGWWGLISMLVTPCFLLNNFIRYVFCLGMTPVQPGATPPELTDAIVEQIAPHANQLFDRLNNGEKLVHVAPIIAERTGVSPGQVVLFVHAVIQSQNES